MRPAGETVALLNDFFAEMIDIVDRNNGIINKFLGDGFLALFGAPLEDPKAAANALAAARGMLEAVDRWNKARPQTTLRVGIGIHLGEAVTGTVGSPQRKEYTVIGDTVNLAARLEQLTKETGSQLLVSSSVHRATTGADGATDLGPLPIRGYDEECGYGRWSELVLRLRLQHERAAAVRGAAEAGRRACGRADRGPARRLAARLQQAGARRRRGAGNIVLAPGEVVHGTLNLLPAKGFEVLDRYEGVAGGHYERRTCRCARRHRRHGRGDHLCRAADGEDLRPTRAYLGHLLAGRDLLPADYFRRLSETPTVD